MRASSYISREYHPKMVVALKKLEANRTRVHTLKKLVSNTRNRPRGLCRYLCIQVHGMVSEDTTYVEHALRRHFRTWPKFSGSIAFPVKGPRGVDYLSQDFESMWLEGPVADARWDLIDHLIKSLEEECL